MMALRLARIFTGRPRILKFAGHFHGWNDFLIPGADAPHDAAVPGIPAEVARDTVIIPPNDLDAVERTLRDDPQIGCVILEPTGGHWGQVPVRGPFLKGLREITTRHDRLLIFDEVITGFRVSPGGAQGHYGIKPDLTTMAKILAGGLPGGCVGGRADILATPGVSSGQAEDASSRHVQRQSAVGVRRHRHAANRRRRRAEPSRQCHRAATPPAAQRPVRRARGCLGRLRRVLRLPAAARLPGTAADERRLHPVWRSAGQTRRCRQPRSDCTPSARGCCCTASI